MSHDPWWKWDWDSHEAHNFDLSYVSLKRWRRGWITLYRFEGQGHDVEWRLYLPFNISIGVQT